MSSATRRIGFADHSVKHQRKISPVVCLLLLAFIGCGSDGGAPATPTNSVSVDLAPDQVAATKGAAPGYVDDQLCAKCHAEIHDAFQHTGKAQSFFAPGAKPVIEEFENNHFYHEPSRRHYEMKFADGQYVFKRYQVDDEGQPINVFRRKVDWVVGSGKRSRNYLYQSESGELFQLPVAWYSQENRWGMAAGFDRPYHDGVTRAVRRECMFCHNAYPDVKQGSDQYGSPHTFPKSLPNGIGCQRCHGPGEKHVLAALKNSEADAVKSSIVNPSKLSSALQEDVCYSCHLQPSFALAGVRRFGRADYSFEPGQRLADYSPQLDVEQTDKARSERFEVNHHAYRLRQSRCFTATEGGVSCMTCHDSHRHVSAENRIGHYRDACAKCHDLDDCTVDQSPVGKTKTRALETNDCVHCHMLRRRAQDVVHVVMTDHLIRRQPGGDLLATFPESKPKFNDVKFLDTGEADELDAELYRAIAVLRSADMQHGPAVARLEQLLDENKSDHFEPYLDLAEGQINQRRSVEAEKTLRSLPQRFSDHGLARQLLGLALNGQRKHSAAIDQLSHATTTEARKALSEYYLGLVLINERKLKPAAKHLETAVQLRPNMVSAWYYLGVAYSELDQLQQAISSFRRVLEIDPSHRRAYFAIEQVLKDSGQAKEATRYRRQAAKLVTATPTALPRVAQPDDQELPPIPSPELDQVEPALKDQIEWAQQLVKHAFTYKVAPDEVAAAYATLGQLYHANEITEHAIACYELSIQVAPKDFRWRHLLSAACEASGDVEKAAESYATTLNLKPDYEPAAIRLGHILLRLEQFEAATEQFQSALDANKNSAAALNGLAAAAIAQKQPKVAVEHLQTILMLVPEAKGVHEQLAAAYRALGEEEKAKQHDDKPGDVEIRPADPITDDLDQTKQAERVYLICGRFAIGVKRFDVAIRALAKAIEVNPTSAQAHVNLGTAQLQLGDIPKAIEAYQIAIRHDPKNFSARFNLGLTLLAEKEYARAAEQFKVAVELQPENASAKQYLEQAQEKAGAE
jgi:tetratricopeptide (TPR) repeat protein